MKATENQKARMRQYYLRNRIRLLERSRNRGRKWRAANPERAREKGRRFYWSNIDRERTRSREKRKKYYRPSPRGWCDVCFMYSVLNQDHDHRTGKDRGLLCTKCNTALGLADDNPFLLQCLAKYLEKHREVVASAA